MRLFVAIDLDENARSAVVAEQRRVRDALGGSRSTLRTVPAGQLHLTLAFLADVGAPTVPSLVEQLTTPFDQARFTVTFGGLGMFPAHGAPRVLWMGLTAGVRETLAVQQEVASRIERVGVGLEERAFHPHLTLGRWRSARPADRARVLSLDSGDLVARIDVGAVMLYRSELSGEGARHTVLARAGLR